MTSNFLTTAALNNVLPLTLHRMLNVILTRPVAFCRVLTLKIRLSNERSSSLSVVMSSLSSPKVSIVIFDVVLLLELS